MSDLKHDFTVAGRFQKRFPEDKQARICFLESDIEGLSLVAAGNFDELVSAVKTQAPILIRKNHKDFNKKSAVVKVQAGRKTHYVSLNL